MVDFQTWTSCQAFFHIWLDKYRLPVIPFPYPLTTINRIHFQVLVFHDLLGMLQHPQHAKVAPKFCKRYADVGLIVQRALEEYKDEVRARTFPSVC